MPLIIIKVCCKDDTITDCYITATNNVVRCSEIYKKKCKNKINHPLYNTINKHGGYKNWHIKILEVIEDQEEDFDITMIVRHYVLMHNATINLMKE